MSVEDFRINAGVRQVLSRNWVDLQQLNFGAAGRIVYFHGRFQKLRPCQRPGDARHEIFEQRSEDLALLLSVERQVRKDPLVIDVVFRLDNFRKVNGNWTTTV
jgi:hypothetical protein